SSAMVTVDAGVVISGGAVTINADADNTDFLASDNTATKVVQKVGDVIDGLLAFGAEFAFSQAEAAITLTAGSTINARALLAHSTANTAAIADPIALGPTSFKFAIVFAWDKANAALTAAGTITTVGDATLQSSSDNTINAVAETSEAKG